MNFARTAFAATLSVLALSPALADQDPPVETAFETGGKFFVTLPQSTEKMSVSHALALACTPGSHHIAARLVMFVDKPSLTAAFPDEAAQTKFLEQTRFKAQSALRVFSKGNHLNWPVTFNKQLDVLGDEIAQKSNVLLSMVVGEKDLMPFSGPCAKLFEERLTVTWPIIQKLDTRKLMPQPRIVPLPLPNPGMPA